MFKLYNICIASLGYDTFDGIEIIRTNPDFTPLLESARYAAQLWEVVPNNITKMPFHIRPIGNVAYIRRVGAS